MTNNDLMHASSKVVLHILNMNMTLVLYIQNLNQCPKVYSYVKANLGD